MKTVSIAEYYQMSKENDECSINVKVEEKPDTSLNPKPHAVMDKTEKELDANEPSKKPLDGQELEPNLDLEFNTADEPVKTGKPLEGGDEVKIEEVCQESNSMARELAERFDYLGKMEDERIALESEIPLQLELLKSPEKITHGDVMLATESLKYKLKLLGIPPKNSKALNVITYESMNTYPATDLMITVEDEKTLLQKLKDAILKVYNWIKDMIMKGINYIAGIKDRIFGKKVEEKVKVVKEKVTPTAANSIEFKSIININHPLVTITASAAMSGYDIDKYFSDRGKIVDEVEKLYSDGVTEATKALATMSKFDSSSMAAKIEELYKRLDSLNREFLKAAHYEKSVTSMLKPGQYLYWITLDDEITIVEYQDKTPVMLPAIKGKDLKPDQDVTFDYETVIAKCELNGKNITDIKNMTVARLKSLLNELKYLEGEVEKTPENGDETAMAKLRIYKEKIAVLKKEVQTMITYPAKYMKQTMDMISILEEAITKSM